MDRVGNKSNDILFLIGFIVLLYVFLIFNKYVQQWYSVYSAKPYCSKHYNNEPIQDKLITWMVHGYIPDHNAGSEWMAHAVNKHWIREHTGRVNVITQNPSVSVYDRVSVINDKKESLDSLLGRSHLLLTHHTMTPRAIQTALEMKKPLVLFLHDNWHYQQAKEAKRWLGENLSIVTNSEWLDKFYSPLQIPSCICYPPVDWREYAVQTNRKYITLINVNKNKGGEVFIDIAKAMPDVQFLGVKGAYQKQITNNTLPNLTYTPTTHEIKNIYEQTNILLMPSQQESWGRTAIEAMSSGIPVIAHPTPGLLESCGDAGIFCDRNNVSEWVREIRKLLDNEEYYQSCSLVSKRRAIQLEPEVHLKKVCKWMENLHWKDGGSPGIRMYPLF
jgi:glycosyltransferase involved in cell wall biosynthesis